MQIQLKKDPVKAQIYHVGCVFHEGVGHATFVNFVWITRIRGLHALKSAGQRDYSSHSCDRGTIIS